MKHLALGLVAASLLLSSGVANAQNFAISKSQQKQMTRFAPAVWPKDANGNPIPNAQNKCPAGYRYLYSEVRVPWFGGDIVNAIRTCVKT